MSQTNVDFSDNPDGPGLMDDYLYPFQNNVLTTNSGSQRPSYAVEGTQWLDTSVTPWILKIYDGTDDIIQGYIDPTNNLYTPAGVLPSQEGQSGKFLQTDGTKTVWNNALDYTNITNCITKIPQDIKLELNNGTLILKAGSQSRDGQGNVINTNSDASFAPTSFINNTYALFVQKNNPQGFDSVPLISIYSGSETPTYTGTFVYYNTTSKKVEVYRNSEFLREASLPIAIYTVVDGKVTSIDKVFNGFGYIGNTIFALPGVKGLIPNGFNADGSLNSIEFTTTSVLTNSNIVSADNADLRLSANAMQTGGLYYDISTNKNYINSPSTDNIRAYAVVGKVSSDSTGRITSLTPNTAFHAVDYSEYAREVGRCAKLDDDNVFTGNNTFTTSNYFTRNAYFQESVVCENRNSGWQDSLTGTTRFGVIKFADKDRKTVSIIQPTGVSDGRRFLEIVLADKNFTNRYYQFYPDRFTMPANPPSSDNSLNAATTAWVRGVSQRFINYSSSVSVGVPTSTSIFTAPTDGEWVGCIGSNNDGGTCSAYINGKISGYVNANGGGYNGNKSPYSIPLKKGETLYFVASAGSLIKIPNTSNNSVFYSYI